MSALPLHNYGKRNHWTIGLFLLVLGFYGCEDVIRISIVDDLAPTFEFSGSGYADLFMVVESEPGQGPRALGDQSRVLWEICPDSTKAGTLPVPRSTYGKVPTGFHQTFPENGPPAPLKEGTTYQAGAPPFAHRYGFVFFKLKGGKATAVSEP